MATIDLNLLPPEQKTRLNRLVQILFAKNLLESIAIALCLFAIILVWSWMVLVQQFNSLSESAMLIDRDYTSYNQEVRQINSITRLINESSSDRLPLVPKILETAQSMPDSIKLNSISINRKDNTFAVSGTATNRNTLLQYQELLQSVGWLKPATMPTTQLLQKENINFEYQTTLIGLPKLRNATVARPRATPKTNEE